MYYKYYGYCLISETDSIAYEMQNVDNLTLYRELEIKIL